MIYAFLASSISKNPALYIKDSSLQQYLTASSRHRCVIADCSHLSPDIIGLWTKIHLRVSVEIIKEI